MPYPYTYQNPYQNYYPASYQPVYQPTQQAQPVQQPTPQQSFSPTPTGIIWISGLQEAQMYPLAPNSAVALWGRDGKTIFLKQSDATGKPSMIVYDLVERTETPSDSGNSGDNKVPAYATKDELGVVVDAVKGYNDVLKRMQTDIEGMKGDLYGAVGKRKPVKKQTEGDEDDA